MKEVLLRKMKEVLIADAKLANFSKPPKFWGNGGRFEANRGGLKKNLGKAEKNLRFIVKILSLVINVLAYIFKEFAEIFEKITIFQNNFEGGYVIRVYLKLKQHEN